MDNQHISFAHISDTHILKNYNTQSSKGWIEAGLYNPTQKLQETLRFIEQKYKNLDFILVSGDLVHDGKSADYEFLKNIFRDITGSVPVFPAMGNHDNRRAFYEGFESRMGNDINDNPYYYVTEVRGLRIIVLDSLVSCETTGEISEGQLSWLKDVLKTPSSMGSIIVLHHPPALNIRNAMFNYSLLNADKMADILSAKSVRAIFAGHVHLNSSLMLGNVPVFTTSGTAFGVDVDPENIYYLKQASFNYCEITINETFVRQHNIAEIVPLCRKI
ncbi:MAG: metallophosphoesterase [Clostridiales bacterium]|nr:metallophosphoesterase [Clostridiales bacterium]